MTRIYEIEPRSARRGRLPTQQRTCSASSTASSAASPAVGPAKSEAGAACCSRTSCACCADCCWRVWRSASSAASTCAVSAARCCSAEAAADWRAASAASALFRSALSRSSLAGSIGAGAAAEICGEIAVSERGNQVAIGSQSGRNRAESPRLRAELREPGAVRRERAEVGVEALRRAAELRAEILLEHLAPLIPERARRLPAAPLERLELRRRVPVMDRTTR